MEIGRLIFPKKCGDGALFSILTIDFKLLTRFINSMPLDLDKSFFHRVILNGPSDVLSGVSANEFDALACKIDQKAFLNPIFPRKSI